MLKYSELKELDVLKKVEDNEPFEFEGTRIELNLFDYEKKFNQDFIKPTAIALMFAQPAANQLIDDALGLHVNPMSLFTKITFLVSENGGTVYYKKTDAIGERWVITVKFGRNTDNSFLDNRV